MLDPAGALYGRDASTELPRVSAVVLAWKAEPWLRRCVEALLASEMVAVDVILVDNGCTNSDVADLSRLPGVVTVGSGSNLGFSAGCNLGVAASGGDYVALINGDAAVEPMSLWRLVEELRQPGVGISVGALRLSEDPALLNSSGNVVHVLGISWVGGFGEAETRTAPTDTAGAAGACLVTRRTHWDRLGGFYEPYFAYHEDSDLSIRTWRLGLRVVSVPDAVIVHRYDFSRNSSKYYLIERNRLMFVSTLWSGRALVLLVPPLLALECAMVLLAARQGWLRDKLRGWGWLVQHRGDILARRRLVQRERVVPDREWMRVLTAHLDTPLVGVPGRRPLNSMMAAYWRLVSRAL
jgi:GT2 family glycosyltransferase